MMNLLEHPLYQKDITYVAGLNLPWYRLKKKKILITGASGLIGSFLIDVLMKLNREHDLCCKIYAIGRNETVGKQRFSEYWNTPYFKFISHDINFPLNEKWEEEFSYILHLASNTHPVVYAENPISTITTNILGTWHLLNYGADHNVERFVVASSNEVYGENRGDVEFFDESYCGYLDCNSLRAGYPESKRCSEALCQAYRKERAINVVIPRFTRSYGPTMRMSDTKAISQFIRKGIEGDNIVLKSAGHQYYSYTYVADAVSGLFMIMFHGLSGEAYNISDYKSDITLKDLSQMVADICNTKVIFEIPDAVEKEGYSKATKARLEGNKLRKLGWEMKYDIRTGLERTIQILHDIYQYKISAKN